MVVPPSLRKHLERVIQFGVPCRARNWVGGSRVAFGEQGVGALGCDEVDRYWCCALNVRSVMATMDATQLNPESST